ncbi:DOPA-like domain-containing protein [Mucidula mucida]|nr:DOPA-like domain-containing protein [Mucidula mucida]
MGAYVAVPLFRFNTEPTGPHPVGSFEVWVPAETFSAVFSYLVLNRGNLSVLVHPLTREPRADHDQRKAWIGDPWPLDLSMLPTRTDNVPSQYASLKLGYNTIAPIMSPDERRNVGAHVSKVLGREELAARPTW